MDFRASIFSNSPDYLQFCKTSGLVRRYLAAQNNPDNPKQLNIWMFPKIGVPQNGWFIMENPIKMDDLGVPLFLETPILQGSQER